MKQADVQYIITEVRNLKIELKEFMSQHTTELEKTNLEAHVDLCTKDYTTGFQRSKYDWAG